MRRRNGLLAISSVVVTALGVAALVIPSASAAANAVVNPGFEQGTSGWSCAPTASSVAGHAHSQSYALAGATTASDTAQCQQTVPVTPNTTYTLSAQVNGSYVFLGVTGGASTWTASTGGAYQQLSVAVSSGAASSLTIYLHGWYGQGTYYADDVALPTGSAPSSPTPSPSSPSPTPTPSPTRTTPPPTTPPPTTATPTPTPTPTSTGTGPGAALPPCQHFSPVTPPDRPAGPSHDSATQAPRISLAGRLPAPGNVHGTLSGGKVTITFDRVSGAVAYRVWRNSQSVAWIDDWGQAALTATDTTPCRNATYTVVALRSDGSDASTGQLSSPYKLLDSGTFGNGSLPAGTRLTYKITSYNDTGQTASGYNAQLGICAVDTRYIPWGTRMKIDGYGYCYAGDIGTWIQGEIVDIWLPGGEADTWGVQSRTITIE
jgi:3D (Asp-Asp-Asp) domain-containing protein